MNKCKRRDIINVKIKKIIKNLKKKRKETKTIAITCSMSNKTYM